MRRSFFFVLLLVLCPVFVSATSLTNGIVSYWKLDESSGTLAVDSVNFANLTAVGGSWTTDGKISNARNQTGSTNRLYSSKIVNSGTGSRTISMWVYANSWSGQRILFGEPLSQDNTALYQFVDWNSNTLRMAGTASLTYGFTNTSVWFHLVSVFNGANSKMYINGVEVASGNTGTYNGNTYQVWGGRNTADHGLDGRLDELSYWNRALNSSEVLELYNAQKDGFSSGQYPTFEVYYLLAKDYFDNSSISNFSVLINGSTYSTTNGSIFLPEGFTDSLWNLTFSSDEAGGYFNRTYLNQNFSSFNTGYLYQAVLDMDAFEKITGNELTGSFVSGSQSGANTLFMKAGTYNITFVNSSYFNKTQEFTITPYQNNTQNITGVYNNVLNLSVYNAWNNATVSNFTGWISNTALSFNETINSTSYTTNINLLQGYNYTIYVESDNYAINETTNNATIYINQSSQALNLSIYTINSIRMYIYDESTGSIINSSTINIQGEDYEATYTTTNGTYFVDNLTDGAYTITFSSANYSSRAYFITVGSRSTQNLNAYLTRSIEKVTFNILDDLTGTTIEGATLVMYKLINNSWSTVESKQSDVSGKVVFTYNDTSRYKFYLTKASYQAKTWELNPILLSSYNIRMQRDVVTTADQPQTVSLSIYPIVFLNNQENNLTFYIASPNGDLVEYGINITYPVGGGVYETYTFSDNNAIGETLTISLNISGATLLDKVNISYFYDTTNGDLVFKSGTYSIINATNDNTFYANIDNEYGLGDFEKVIVVTIIMIVIMGIGVIVGGSVLGGVLGLILFGYFSFMGFIPLWSVILTLIAILSYVIGKS